MPGINAQFLTKLRDDYTKYPIFVETGTNMGYTTFACEPLFETIYTIELGKELYDKVSKGYSRNTIHFLHGDSTVVFTDLLPTLDKPTVFFLDGHWSGGGTAKGAKDCPLIEEVSHIARLFRHEGIIIIDDYRLFGKGPRNGPYNEDWESIRKEDILDIVYTRLESVYHLESELSPDDRLVIHIRRKEA